MDSMDRFYKLVEELSTVAYEIWPDAANASVTVGDHGYIDITVTQFDKDEKTPYDDRKRRALFLRTKVRGEWNPEFTEKQNDYYKKCGCLLEA